LKLVYPSWNLNYQSKE